MAIVSVKRQGTGIPATTVHGRRQAALILIFILAALALTAPFHTTKVS